MCRPSPRRSSSSQSRCPATARGQASDCGEYGARAVWHQPDEKVEDGRDVQVAVQRAQHFCLNRRRAIYRLGTCRKRKSAPNFFIGPNRGGCRGDNWVQVDNT